MIIKNGQRRVERPANERREINKRFKKKQPAELFGPDEIKCLKRNFTGATIEELEEFGQIFDG